MAIAYFIPDQAKLLAGQRPTARGSSNAGSSRTQQQQSNQSNESAPVNTTANRGYGSTINITVPTMNNTTQEPLGFWDFLTQVFCHALRFYHDSSQLQPTVIQISVNFNSQPATETEIAANTTATATTNQQQTPPAEASANSSTSEEQKSRKCSKQNN